jgi:Winged helix-turn helix
MIQDLISRCFGVLYHPHYICTLLDNLGFSYQKARFVSDHLDEVKRLEWRHTKWPQVLRQARQRHALLLFGEEASFAQWGSLSYTWARKGQQPEVPTSGKRHASKVFGLIDYFSGRFFYKAPTGRFNSESYTTFLLDVLSQVAPQLTVVTSTTSQSGVAGYARDAHVASGVSSAAVAHGTPTVLAPSSNGR